MNFLIETAIALEGTEYPQYEGPLVSNRFTTNNVIDFSDYVVRATEYYKNMVQFETGVKYVSMLVRTYRDHHVIYISFEDGKLKVTSNQ